MMKSCPYCGGIHKPGTICIKKPTRRSGKHKSKAGDLRHKAVWTRKSLEIRERDMYVCRWCLKQGVINTHDLSVHHIIPINKCEDSWLDNDNLITLCKEHHEEAEQGKITEKELRELAMTVCDVAKYTPLPSKRR